MAAADIDTLDITTLDSGGVAAVIAVGETVVERKREATEGWARAERRRVRE